MTKKENVLLSITRDHALVLFEWLTREDEEEGITTKHPSEQRVLWDIQAMLEKALSEPLSPNYDEALAAARDRLTVETK